MGELRCYKNVLGLQSAQLLSYSLGIGAGYLVASGSDRASVVEGVAACVSAATICSAALFYPYQRESAAKHLDSERNRLIVQEHSNPEVLRVRARLLQEIDEERTSLATLTRAEYVARTTLHVARGTALGILAGGAVGYAASLLLR